MGDYLQRHRRKTRLERAATKEMLYAASIKKAVQFLDLFKGVLEILGDGKNWAVYPSTVQTDPNLLGIEYVWVGEKNPLEIIRPVLDQWEKEVNGEKRKIDQAGVDKGSRGVITESH